MRTLAQSASSSSATISGSVVRAAPVPISARAATMVTMPSRAIETKMCGSLTVPFGILSAPVGVAERVAHGGELRGEHEAAARRGP